LADVLQRDVEKILNAYCMTAKPVLYQAPLTPKGNDLGEQERFWSLRNRKPGTSTVSLY